MHWVDRAAEKTREREVSDHVVASGTSISGCLHIGATPDILIADSIAKVLEKKGENAESVWYTDDIDPMRRVPWPLSEEEYERYLGMPYVEIPSPDSEHENFVDFFKKPFLESLERFGVDSVVYSSAEVYREGRLADQTRIALESSEEIRKILNEYRDVPLPEGWLPFDPICEECGRIATTRAYDWEDEHVYYKCEEADYVEGCGHEGVADYTRGEGKLTWRVEWPARWEMLGVTCEPFGKDHAAAGGSYDTGKLIAERVYDYDPPVPVPYEWISLRGEPMSSSKGRVFTPSEWLEVAEPELLRYFIFRSKAKKAKDFDPSYPLLDLYKEYRQLEDVYFGREEVKESREEQEKRIYELSQVGEVPDEYPQRVPFRLAVVLIQVAQDIDYAIDILRRKGVLEEPEEWEIDMANDRLRRARNWVEKYAPEQAKLKILDELPESSAERLSPRQKKCLSLLAEQISKKEFEPVEVHNRVYEIARNNDIEPVELFQAIYLVLLGQKSGPRVGNFLTALEDEFVVERFEEAAN
ncbi:lysyl-tRNA synthetase [candidate division MSBL1 archaeon SCGC-AAA259O05]|uniref:Lysine--tRNA ligase n=1 Tax=candidate division MSBL1 archaeon SCGC-AAA259O05 TaxID=1698271 RepID=A0A133V4M4_9EURY|nr:lysyl-tRNA synthetase [candidate division MSBL1 archaeon SCGC-AAA259O05]